MNAKSLFISRVHTFPYHTLIWLVTMMMFGSSVFADELLRNGSFSNHLAGWKISNQLEDWNPWENGAVNLHPPGFGYTGILLYQNVNASVAGQTLTLSLQLQKQYGSSGSTINLSVDYLATNGVIKRFKVLAPANDDLPAMVYTNVTANFVLPDEAAKLVRLLISKEDYGDFLADDISLSASALSPGAVPQIISMSPGCGPYASGTNNASITIRGQNFGSSGQAWLATAPVEAVGAVVPASAMQIVSWSSTQVVARVVEPLRSGKVNLFTGGAESDGDFNFTVTSPTFTVDVVTPNITAIRGETVDVVLRVDFLNGFQSSNGVSFMMTDPFGVGTSTDQPLKRSGGHSFRLNTATLTNGVYQGMVQSLEDHSYARFTPFKLNVVSITNIDFFEYDTNYQRVAISSKTVTNQGQFYISYELFDHEGKAFNGTGFGALPLNIVSFDPAKFFVFNGNFGPRFYSVANGSANATFSTPNGFSKVLPVAINFPAAPQVTNAVMTPPVADNSGMVTNALYFQATEWLTWLGYEGFLGIGFDEITRSDYAASWVFTVPAGTPPGEYLLYTTTASGTASRYFPLIVENAPSRGKIEGRFIFLESGEGHLHDVMGTLELYDAGMNLVATNRIEGYGKTSYSAGYVPPGTFRARFVPDMGYVPQWYPSAHSFAGALPVPVLAGQTTGEINFYMQRPGIPPPTLNVPPPVVAGGNLEFTIPTAPNVDYFLECIDSLSSTNWSVAQFLSGDSGVRTLADPNPSSAVRFYRVRMQPR